MTEWEEAEGNRRLLGTNTDEQPYDPRRPMKIRHEKDGNLTIYRFNFEIYTTHSFAPFFKLKCLNVAKMFSKCAQVVKILVEYGIFLQNAAGFFSEVKNIFLFGSFA